MGRSQCETDEISPNHADAADDSAPAEAETSHKYEYTQSSVHTDIPPAGAPRERTDSGSTSTSLESSSSDLRFVLDARGFGKRARAVSRSSSGSGNPAAPKRGHHDDTSSPLAGSACGKRTRAHSLASCASGNPAVHKKGGSEGCPSLTFSPGKRTRAASLDSSGVSPPAPAKRVAHGPASGSDSESESDPDSDFPHECPVCDEAFDRPALLAQHVRGVHDSAVVLPSDSVLQHCPCGALYAKGSSLAGHLARCPCLRSHHRRLGPHCDLQDATKKCPCAGCATAPYTVGCDPVSCVPALTNSPAQKQSRKSRKKRRKRGKGKRRRKKKSDQASPSANKAGTSKRRKRKRKSKSKKGGVNGGGGDPSSGDSSSSSSESSENASVGPEVPLPAVGAIPLAALKIVRDFPLQPRDCRVGVVEQLFTNQEAKLIECQGKVMSSMRAYHGKNAPSWILETHLRLLLFVPKLLCGRFRNQRERDLGRAVLFRRFLDFDFDPLLERARQAGAARARSSATLDNRVQRLVRQNRLGAAAAALEEKEVAPNSKAVHDELAAKFPALKRPIVVPADEEKHAPEALTVEDLQTVAAKVNKHAAAGPSGARMWFYTSPLRKASPTAHDTRFAQDLCWLANRVVNGAEWTAGIGDTVRLIAILEANGRNRPIQIAECLDRLIGKVLVSKYLADLKDHFGDLQSGIAKSGAERMVHLARMALDTLGDTPFIVTFDYANAFNEISRATIREQLALHFPSLLPYFDLRYRHPSKVFFYNRALLAREGVRQGDPWGPIFFALALHSVLTKLEDEFPDNVTGAYLDDVYTVFPSSSVSCVPFFQAMAREGAEVGLRLRMKKSSVYAPLEFAADFVTEVDRAALQQVAAVDAGALPAFREPGQGVELLGSAIGADDFVKSFSDGAVHGIRDSMQLLEKIQHLPQEYVLLLRHCFNTKPMHLARTVEPRLLRDAARVHDAAVNRLVAQVFPGVNSSASAVMDLPRALKQVRLPKSFGGFALTSLDLVRHAAYLASVSASWSHMACLGTRRLAYWTPLLRRPLETLASHTVLLDCPSSYCPRDMLVASASSRQKSLSSLLGYAPAAQNEPNPSLLERFTNNPTQAIEAFVGLVRPATQKQLTRIMHGALYDRCLREFYPQTLTRRPASAARFLSSSTASAVAFAHAVPVHQDFVTPPRAYLNGVSMLLQTEVPGRNAIGDSCPYRKGHRMDKQGYHLFSCGSHRSIPHDALRDAVHELCTAAGLTSVVEPTNCLTMQDAASATRPDLLISGLAAGGKDVLVDFTTVDVAADTVLRGPTLSYCTVNSASRHGESRKRQGYQGRFDPARFVFVPGAIELAGRWGTSLEKLFGDICRHATVSKGLSALRSGLFQAYWRRVIAVRFSRALFKGAADMQQQLTKSDVVLDPARELAIV